MTAHMIQLLDHLSSCAFTTQEFTGSALPHQDGRKGSWQFYHFFCGILNQSEKPLQIKNKQKTKSVLPSSIPVVHEEIAVTPECFKQEYKCMRLRWHRRSY